MMKNSNEMIHTKKVRQSNDLIESPYAQEFSAHEIKLFEIAVASCTQEDYKYIERKSDKEFSISNGELAKLLHTKPNVISMEIEKTSARIMKKTMHLRKILDDGSIEFEMINIIPFARYKNGIFHFRLNYSVIPYLIEINKNFTEYQLHYLLLLNSAYAIKLYKLLYQYKNIKSRSFSIVDLKEQFGIMDKYPLYGSFKKFVIDPSIIQINKLTDLVVSYNEIKFGRKVDRLEFIFEVKSQSTSTLKHNSNSADNVDVTHPLPNVDHLLGAIDLEISTCTKDLVVKYCTEKSVDYVEASIGYAKKHAKTNLDKYLNDTLVNGWAEVKVKKITEKKAKDHAKINAIKQDSIRKEQDKEADNLNKSMIEHKWNKLLDKDKSKYISYATYILNKYSKKLTHFPSIEQSLPLCIYAVSNQKHYDRMLESYIQNFLNTSLNVMDYIATN